MKRKLSVAEFASIVGTTSKTIYERIKKNSELPLEEQLETVNEKVKGREVVLIQTDSDQIELYKNIYGKNLVNNSEYYENVTDNNSLKQDINGYKPVNNNDDNTFNHDLFEKLTTLNNEYNNRIDTVRNELLSVHKQLMESEKKTLFLEDKANREGLYLQEINELKTDNKKQNNLIKLLITVLVLLLMVIITFITYYITVNINVNNGYNSPVTDSITSEILQ